VSDTFLSLRALTAAGGNSRAARALRVKLQWRDRKGQWIEMGRGAKFKVRGADGAARSVIGSFVGAIDEKTGQVYVSKDPNGLPDGFYNVDSANAEKFAATLNSSEAPASSGGSVGERASENIPSINELTVKGAPEGWNALPGTFGGKKVIETEDGDFRIHFGGKDETVLLEDHRANPGVADPQRSVAEAFKRVGDVDAKREETGDKAYATLGTEEENAAALQNRDRDSKIEQIKGNERTLMNERAPLGAKQTAMNANEALKKELADAGEPYDPDGNDSDEAVAARKVAAAQAPAGDPALATTGEIDLDTFDVAPEGFLIPTGKSTNDLTPEGLANFMTAEKEALGKGGARLVVDTDAGTAEVYNSADTLDNAKAQAGGLGTDTVLDLKSGQAVSVSDGAVDPNSPDVNPNLDGDTSADAPSGGADNAQDSNPDAVESEPASPGADAPASDQPDGEADRAGDAPAADSPPADAPAGDSEPAGEGNEAESGSDDADSAESDSGEGSGEGSSRPEPGSVEDLENRRAQVQSALDVAGDPKDIVALNEQADALDVRIGRINGQQTDINGNTQPWNADINKINSDIMYGQGQAQPLERAPSQDVSDQMSKNEEERQALLKELSDAYDEIDSMKNDPEGSEFRQSLVEDLEDRIAEVEGKILPKLEKQYATLNKKLDQINGVQALDFRANRSGTPAKRTPAAPKAVEEVVPEAPAEPSIADRLDEAFNKTDAWSDSNVERRERAALRVLRDEARKGDVSKGIARLSLEEKLALSPEIAELVGMGKLPPQPLTSTKKGDRVAVGSPDGNIGIVTDPSDKPRGFSTVQMENGERGGGNFPNNRLFAPSEATDEQRADRAEVENDDRANERADLPVSEPADELEGLEAPETAPDAPEVADEAPAAPEAVTPPADSPEVRKKLMDIRAAFARGAKSQSMKKYEGFDGIDKARETFLASPAMRKYADDPQMQTLLENAFGDGWVNDGDIPFRERVAEWRSDLTGEPLPDAVLESPPVSAPERPAYQEPGDPEMVRVNRAELDAIDQEIENELALAEATENDPMEQAGHLSRVRTLERQRKVYQNALDRALGNSPMDFNGELDWNMRKPENRGSLPEAPPAPAPEPEAVPEADTPAVLDDSIESAPIPAPGAEDGVETDLVGVDPSALREGDYIQHPETGNIIRIEDIEVRHYPEEEASKYSINYSSKNDAEEAENAATDNVEIWSTETLDTYKGWGPDTSEPAAKPATHEEALAAYDAADADYQHALMQEDYDPAEVERLEDIRWEAQKDLWELEDAQGEEVAPEIQEILDELDADPENDRIERAAQAMFEEYKEQQAEEAGPETVEEVGDDAPAQSEVAAVNSELADRDEIEGQVDVAEGLGGLYDGGDDPYDVEPGNDNKVAALKAKLHGKDLTPEEEAELNEALDSGVLSDSQVARIDAEISAKPNRANTTTIARPDTEQPEYLSTADVDIVDAERNDPNFVFDEDLTWRKIREEFPDAVELENGDLILETVSNKGKRYDTMIRRTKKNRFLVYVMETDQKGNRRAKRIGNTEWHSYEALEKRITQGRVLINSKSPAGSLARRKDQPTENLGTQGFPQDDFLGDIGNVDAAVPTTGDEKFDALLEVAAKHIRDADVDIEGLREALEATDPGANAVNTIMQAIIGRAQDNYRPDGVAPWQTYDGETAEVGGEYDWTDWHQELDWWLPDGTLNPNRKPNPTYGEVHRVKVMGYVKENTDGKGHTYGDHVWVSVYDPKNGTWGNWTKRSAQTLRAADSGSEPGLPFFSKREEWRSSPEALARRFRVPEVAPEEPVKTHARPKGDLPQSRRLRFTNGGSLAGYGNVPVPNSPAAIIEKITSKEVTPRIRPAREARPGMMVVRMDDDGNQHVDSIIRVENIGDGGYRIHAARPDGNGYADVDSFVVPGDADIALWTAPELPAPKTPENPNTRQGEVVVFEQDGEPVAGVVAFDDGEGTLTVSTSDEVVDVPASAVKAPAGGAYPSVEFLEAEIAKAEEDLKRMGNGRDSFISSRITRQRISIMKDMITLAKQDWKTPTPVLVHNGKVASVAQKDGKYGPYYVLTDEAAEAYGKRFFSPSQARNGAERDKAKGFTYEDVMAPVRIRPGGTDWDIDAKNMLGKNISDILESDVTPSTPGAERQELIEVADTAAVPSSLRDLIRRWALNPNVSSSELSQVLDIMKGFNAGSGLERFVDRILDMLGVPDQSRFDSFYSN